MNTKGKNPDCLKKKKEKRKSKIQLTLSNSSAAQGCLCQFLSSSQIHNHSSRPSGQPKKKKKVTNTGPHKKSQLHNTKSQTTVHKKSRTQHTTVHKKRRGQRAERARGRAIQQRQKNTNMNLREDRNFSDLPCLSRFNSCVSVNISRCRSRI